KHGEVYAARFGLNALGDLRASTAVFAVIDDHEISNNFAGGAPTDSNSPGTSAAFFNETIIYRTALQAFHEYNPIQEQTYDTPGHARTHGKPKLYRTRRFGSDAAIFLLDARSFRDRELPEVRNPLNTEEIDAFNSLTFDLDPKTGTKLPRRTMLGAQQLSDLKEDLLAARMDGVLWKFVLVPEPMQNFGFADGQDRFEGYATERTELLKFIADHQIKNVVFISADIHGTVVNNLNYQLGPGQPGIPTESFEVVTGPVAYDKPFGPTVFDAAERIDFLPGANLLQLILRSLDVANRAAFDALPQMEKDRLFKSVMDTQLNLLGLDSTGLDSSDVLATLTTGNYVAVHTYGWTEFEIDRLSHRLTVTTYGIPPYTPGEATEAVVSRAPAIVSAFTVLPQTDPLTSPELEVARVATGVRVSWPLGATNFVLQSAISLGDTPDWSDETLNPTTVGEQNVVLLQATSVDKFYRLRRR
ncbi:MAG: alkaline phosphatase D family protein, partial [Verrucomicrobiales bacterium]|nr:alkaline phosphatase D family protein [Verrucomicrobiales bacterium]